MVTPADSDGNGGSTSQDRQDDMQQGNELMEIDNDNDDGDDDEEEEVESTDGVHSEDASYRTCRRSTNILIFLLMAIFITVQDFVWWGDPSYLSQEDLKRILIWRGLYVYVM